MDTRNFGATVINTSSVVLGGGRGLHGGRNAKFGGPRQSKGLARKEMVSLELEGLWRPSLC